MLFLSKKQTNKQTETCSPRWQKQAHLFFWRCRFSFSRLHIAVYRIPVWWCWYFMVYIGELEASAKIYVYMCLFWWEYLYRYISENFLRGLKSCDCFHYRWISHEDLKKREKKTKTSIQTRDQNSPPLSSEFKKRLLKKSINLERRGFCVRQQQFVSCLAVGFVATYPDL